MPQQPTWDIALQDGQHQPLRLQFDTQRELQKFIMTLTVEQLLNAIIYDPDQRSMDGKTYLYHFL
ncbi:hypothetical protein [Paenibacillus wulumuqiensis]|uniref:hypothetical protein n=1 Tax=Paenibacillus wulumuqiensis TaxID=1567107 RepID=UPI00061935FD|nr:hypothetical protein [Paenibacillus wulumuqiensis]